jgi:ectoine hydroxylase-related dioxygenase (phytanoyl-CoA dioxygenase family)
MMPADIQRSASILPEPVMNKHPLRPITDQDIAAYKRDGVVCLRNVLDQEWIESLKTNCLAARLHPERFGLLPNQGNPRYMARTMPEFREFAFHSPIAEAAARVMQSRTIRFFFDEMFSKEPQSTNSTIWHNDRPGWPVTGQMVPSIWVPLTPITKANSLEVLAGSHRHDVLYWLFSPNALKMVRPDGRPGHPDVEALRQDPKMNFMSWDMDPGDILILHPWVLHYNAGNPTDEWRLALSTRVFGDDIRWAPRPDCLNIAGISLDEMIEGEAPAGPLLPLIWSEDGSRDDTQSYPHGFATIWSSEAYERERTRRAAATGGFVKRLKDVGGPTPVRIEDLKAAIRQSV